jgi:MFS transporter, PPP family, 3-phenylpropionic acid transporter
MYVASGVGNSFYIPFVGLMLADGGLSPTAIGLAMALIAISGVLMSVIWSNVADRHLGTVRTLRIVMLIATAMAITFFAVERNHVAIYFAAIGLGSCLVSGRGLLDTSAMTHLGPARRKEFGSIRLWESGGFGVSAIIAGLILQVAGVRWGLVMYGCGILALVAMTRPLPARRVQPGEFKHAKSRLGTANVALRTTKGLPLFLAGWLLYSLGTNTAQSFAPLQIVGRGGGAFLVGVSFGLAALLEIPFMQLSVRLGKRVGLSTLIFSGMAVYALLFVAYAFVSSPLAITLMTTARGAGFGLLCTGSVQLVGSMVPHDLRNSGQVLLGMAANLGPVLGYAMGGAVFAHLGGPTLFIGCAALIGISAVVVAAGLSRAGALGGQHEPVPRPEALPAALALQPVAADASWMLGAVTRGSVSRRR